MGTDSPPDLYAVLGVHPTAGRAEIKTAWMRAARLYHPDMGGDTADAEKFQEIQQAYDILSNDAERAAYDEMFGAGVAETTPTGEPDTAPGWDGSPAPVPPAPGATAPPAYADTARREYPDIRPSFDTADGFRPAVPSAPAAPVAAWRLRIPKSDHVSLTPGWKGTWSAALITGAVLITTWERALTLAAREPVEWLWSLSIVAVLALALGCAVTVASLWRRKMSHAAEVGGMAAAGLMVWVAAQTPEPGTAKAAIISAGSGLVFSAALAFGIHRQRAISRVLSHRQAREFRVFGKPGAAAVTSGQRLVQFATAEKAHQYLDLPNVKIAHHVRIPADPKTTAPDDILHTAAGAPVKMTGSVDTAVLSADRLLLLDSAVVPGGDYSVDPQGTILVDGVPTPSASITTLAEARAAWQKLLGKRAKVEAVLVLYPDGQPGKVLTEGLPVAILPESTAFDAAGNFLVQDIRTIDRRLINDLYARTSG